MHMDINRPHLLFAPNRYLLSAYVNADSGFKVSIYI
jgi:hypothetical protein